MFRITLAAALLTACSPEVDETVDPDTDPSTASSIYDMTPEQVAVYLDGGTGCSDVSVNAWSSDSEALLAFGHNDELVAGLYDTMDDSVTVSWSLPDAAVELELLVGSGLREYPCNDVGFMGTIDDTLTAVSGTATLTLERTSDTYEAWEKPADATLDLQDVVLENATGDVVTVDDLVLEHHVGWLPG
jgi:hypothetical protein